jgi:hypothetical protein
MSPELCPDDFVELYDALRALSDAVDQDPAPVSWLNKPQRNALALLRLLKDKRDAALASIGAMA